MFSSIITALALTFMTASRSGSEVATPRIEIIDRQAPQTIAAPHGHFDRHTTKVARALCKALEWNCVLATGYRNSKHPFNVNRGTQGIPPAREEPSDEAIEVYERFSSPTRQFGDRYGLALYVEIHGNSRSQNKSVIEIATTGRARQEACTIHALFDIATAELGMEEIRTRVEGCERVYFGATSAKEDGTLSQFKPALHIELPLQMRTSARRGKTVAVIAHALGQLVNRWSEKDPEEVPEEASAQVGPGASAWKVPEEGPGPMMQEPEAPTVAAGGRPGEAMGEEEPETQTP